MKRIIHFLLSASASTPFNPSSRSVRRTGGFHFICKCLASTDIISFSYIFFLSYSLTDDDFATCFFCFFFWWNQHRSQRDSKTSRHQGILFLVFCARRCNCTLPLMCISGDIEIFTILYSLAAAAVVGADTQRMGKALCSLCFDWNRYKCARFVGRGGECKHGPIEHQRSWNWLAFRRCAQSDTLTKCWTKCCEHSACESFTFNF